MGICIALRTETGKDLEFIPDDKNVLHSLLPQPQEVSKTSGQKIQFQLKNAAPINPADFSRSPESATMHKPYEEAFPVGSRVRIADRAFLEEFARTWKYHHPLAPEQLEFAGKEATVEKVGFYHGGDQLYNLRGIPGIWNEECLRRVREPSA